MKTPDRPLVIVKDSREPDEEANDHPSSVFRPAIFASGIAKGTPYEDRPRLAVPVVRQGLSVGDYSLPGLETTVALERKSGPDLLSTLFGDAGLDSVGEAKHNLDRFRAELERAYVGHYQLFAIVTECSQGWLFTEAKRRQERYGKSFDPFAALGLLRSFAVDLACPTIWCGSKAMAELEVGETLKRVWSQATDGGKAMDARKRGYAIPWLGAVGAEAAE